MGNKHVATEGKTGKDEKGKVKKKKLKRSCTTNKSINLKGNLCERNI